MYSATDSQVKSTPWRSTLIGMASASAKNSRYQSWSPGRAGAITWPHWPTRIVVWPFCTEEPQYGSQSACGSKCVW